MKWTVTQRSEATGNSVRATEETFVPPLFTRGVPAGSPACCCPAPAQYAAYVAASRATLNPAEILLCAHHLRGSAERLARPDVAVYDADGRYVDMRDLLTATLRTQADRPAEGGHGSFGSTDCSGDQRTLNPT